MAEGRSEEIIGSEETAIHSCEVCDQPSRHLIKFISQDNREHYVCWSCRYREEKHINLKPGWKRGRRER
jgi:hypothetical protein